MIPGKTALCDRCAQPVEFRMGERPDGCYIGSQCACGPYWLESEESYGSAADAEKALRDGTWTVRGIGVEYRLFHFGLDDGFDATDLGVLG